MGGCTSTSTYNYAGDPSSSHVSSDLDFKNRPILGPCLGLTGFLNTSWSDLVLRKPQNMWIDCEYMSPTAILAHTNCKLQEAFQEVPMKAFTISNMARISSNCKFPSGKIVMGGIVLVHVWLSEIHPINIAQWPSGILTVDVGEIRHHLATVR